MKIVVLHSVIAADAGPDDLDTLDQMEQICRALGELGHSARRLPCDLNLAEAAENLSAYEPDVVFNLVETINGSAQLAHLAPAMLDHLHLRYTGSPTDACYVSANKLLAKDWLLVRGVRVPCGFTLPLPRGAALPSTQVVLKSVWEHASAGMDDTVVFQPQGRAELERRLRLHGERLGGLCFAEEYVDGREFNVSILELGAGPVVLPIAEIVFEGYADKKPKIVGHAAKWLPETFEYSHTIRSFARAERDRTLHDRLAQIALDCYSSFGLRGYGRVDFRVDRAGEPYVLEVNTNPCLAADAGLMAAAAEHGLSATQVIDAILLAAQRPYASAIPASVPAEWATSHAERAADPSLAMPE